MIEYSLDTNACIGLLNGSSSTLRTMVTEALGEELGAVRVVGGAA